MGFFFINRTTYLQHLKINNIAMKNVVGIRRISSYFSTCSMFINSGNIDRNSAQTAACSDKTSVNLIYFPLQIFISDILLTLKNISFLPSHILARVFLKIFNSKIVSIRLKYTHIHTRTAAMVYTLLKNAARG